MENKTLMSIVQYFSDYIENSPIFMEKRDLFNDRFLKHIFRESGNLEEAKWMIVVMGVLFAPFVVMVEHLPQHSVPHILSDVDTLSPELRNWFLSLYYADDQRFFEYEFVFSAIQYFPEREKTIENARLLLALRFWNYPEDIPPVVWDEMEYLPFQYFNYEL